MIKLFVVDTNTEWFVTDNEVLAMELDVDYRLASIDDLHNEVALSGITFEGKKLVTTNGVVQWFTQSNIDELGMDDYICEYRLVS